MINIFQCNIIKELKDFSQKGIKHNSKLKTLISVLNRQFLSRQENFEGTKSDLNKLFGGYHTFPYETT